MQCKIRRVRGRGPATQDLIVGIRAERHQPPRLQLARCNVASRAEIEARSAIPSALDILLGCHPGAYE